jgi:hypothetical protein
LGFGVITIGPYNQGFLKQYKQLNSIYKTKSQLRKTGELYMDAFDLLLFNQGVENEVELPTVE